MAGGPETALNIVSTGGLSLLVELIEDKDGAMITIEDALAVLVAIAQPTRLEKQLHMQESTTARSVTRQGGMVDGWWRS